MALPNRGRAVTSVEKLRKMEDENVSEKHSSPSFRKFVEGLEKIGNPENSEKLPKLEPEVEPELDSGGGSDPLEKKSILHSVNPGEGDRKKLKSSGTIRLAGDSIWNSLSPRSKPKPRCSNLERNVTEEPKNPEDDLQSTPRRWIGKFSQKKKKGQVSLEVGDHEGTIHEKKSLEFDFGSEKVMGIAILGLRQGRHVVTAINQPVTSKRYRAPNLEVLVIWDPDKEYMKEVMASELSEHPSLISANSYSAAFTFPGVDIVAIYVQDPTLRFELLMDAMKAGKHVIIEHPFVTRVEHARSFWDFVATTELTGQLRVVQAIQVFPSFVYQHKMYVSGVLGDLEMLEAYLVGDIIIDGNTNVMTHFRPLAALAPVVTVMRCFIQDVAEVHSFGIVSCMSSSKGSTVKDLFTVNVISKSGQICKLSVHCSLNTVPGDYQIGCKLYGSKGTSTATYPDMVYHQHVVNTTKEPEKSEFLSPENLEFYFNKEKPQIPYGCYANYIGHYAKAIMSGQPDKTKTNIAQGLQTLVIMEAIRRSAEEKRAVKIKEIRSEVFGRRGKTISE